MSNTKESKDGWIRHRGGKCPVAEGVIVEVRFRSGEVEIDSGWPRWEHNGGKRDIMAYRIFETSQQVENSPTSDIQNAQEDEGDPLVWRDRIYELAAQQEEITEVYNRQSSEIAAERESLIQRLESEGFRLIDKNVEPEKLEKWQRYAIDGIKINAIKEHRTLTGSGLKEAKDAVEAYQASRD